MKRIAERIAHGVDPFVTGRPVLAWGLLAVLSLVVVARVLFVLSVPCVDRRPIPMAPDDAPEVQAWRACTYVPVREWLGLIPRS